jgi:hypothetical protein
MTAAHPAPCLADCTVLYALTLGASESTKRCTYKSPSGPRSCRRYGITTEVHLQMPDTRVYSPRSLARPRPSRYPQARAYNSPSSDLSLPPQTRTLKPRTPSKHSQPKPSGHIFLYPNSISASRTRNTHFYFLHLLFPATNPETPTPFPLRVLIPSLWLVCGGSSVSRQSRLPPCFNFRRPARPWPRPRQKYRSRCGRATACFMASGQWDGERWVGARSAVLGDAGEKQAGVFLLLSFSILRFWRGSA